MRSVIQRVTQASVSVAGETLGQIDKGFVALLGVAAGDTLQDAQYMADKIAKLRIFEDQAGKMNLALPDVGGAVLAISQFTLLGDARGQNRPGFTAAEAPHAANALYEACCQRLAQLGLQVVRGRFGAHMQITLNNDGPVTILLDSRKAF